MFIMKVLKSLLFFCVTLLLAVSFGSVFSSCSKAPVDEEPYFELFVDAFPVGPDGTVLVAQKKTFGCTGEPGAFTVVTVPLTLMSDGHIYYSYPLNNFFYDAAETDPSSNAYYKFCFSVHAPGFDYTEWVCNDAR